MRTDNNDFVVVETDDLKELIEKEGVLKAGDESKAKEFVSYAREVLEVEAEEKIRKLELKKNIYDVIEIPELKVYMTEEATSGPFYDEERGEEVTRNGVSYDYWKYHEYPVVEVWAYYNDKYFTDKKEEVASGWSKHAKTVLEDDILGGFVKQGFDIFGIFGDFVDWLKGFFFLERTRN